jgi:predicted Fe-Mo cluster-binding NifX family protein
MAAAPVVIDCGGSTRVKQLGNVHNNMDGLIGTPHQDNADGTFPANVGAGVPANAVIKLAHVTPTGGHGSAHAQVNMGAGDTLVITSEFGQQATLTLSALGILALALTGPAGVPPLVDARQVGNQRRYEVVNAGAITTVVLNPAAGPPVQLFPTAGIQAVYVSVHLS